jgi:mannitol-1-/sugar-/sorbitol-6-phosphatase
MVPVSDMLALVLPQRSRTAPLLVGIDGRSRSGKSTLAALIARCIQGVVVIHTDEVAWHHSFFGWSDVLIEGVLRPLRRDGLPLSYTPQPWIERGRPGSIAIPGGTEIILVEGVGAARRELSNWFNATIWVQTDPDVAMARTIALDRDPPGFIDDWMRAENAHLAADQPWTRASAVVSGEYPVSSDAVRVCLRAPDATACAVDGCRTFQAAGVLFDNDGVLVDSHSVAARVWNLWATRWVPGFDFHRDIRHGLRLSDVVADLVSAEHVATAAENLIDMELTLATEVPPIPGAPELIADCPAGSWALVTSGRRSVALARLTSAGIARPVTVVSADDVERGKPAPDPYLAGAAALGLRPERCIVFEDARAGIISARAAGVAHVIGVGEATVGEDVDATVSNLSGITFDGTHVSIPPELIIEPH